MDIFDEIDDMAWHTSALLDMHAPIKTRIVKYHSVPYMNSVLRKAQYERNMIRNKFKWSGKQYREQNHRARNQVVKIRKKIDAKYISKTTVRKMIFF